MRTLAIHARPTRQRRSSGLESLLSTRSIDLEWRYVPPTRVDESAQGETADQPPFPTVVELHDGERSPATSCGAVPHHPTKTFAELQQILIRHELLGAVADRAWPRAQHDQPDAVSRLRESAESGAAEISRLTRWGRGD